MTGWIKVFRKIIDDEIWNSPEPYDSRSAWLDLLLRAAYERQEVKTSQGIVILQPGELITTEAELAARWKWSRRKVRKFLADNKLAKRRTGNGTRSGTILTLENYTIYQGKRTKSDTKTDTKSGQEPGQTEKNIIYINNIKESSRREEEQEGKEARLQAMRERRDEALRRWEAKA